MGRSSMPVSVSDTLQMQKTDVLLIRWQTEKVPLVKPPGFVYQRTASEHTTCDGLILTHASAGGLGAGVHFKNVNGAF